MPSDIKDSFKLVLVFGCVAEASEDVTELISDMAHVGAARAGLARGSLAYATAVGNLAWQSRRTLACTAWRSLAGLVRDRAIYVDTGEIPWGTANARNARGGGPQGAADAAGRAYAAAGGRRDAERDRTSRG